MTVDPVKILVVDDDDSIRQYLVRLLRSGGYEVLPASGGREALRLVHANADICLALIDIVMPDMDGLETLAEVRKVAPLLPVVMLSALGQAGTIVKAMKAGANDYLVKPFEETELESAVGRAIEKKRILAEAVATGQAGVEDERRELVFRSAQMRTLNERINLLADSAASILIEGESGTGKAQVARALHYRSARRDKPFIKICCAALSREMLELELFGQERAAQGSVKIGKLELADGGTLFLDEVAELDLSVQARLLQVIQEGTVCRLGARSGVSVDVRVIAATNRDLKTLVDLGKFRADLYYRLNELGLRLAPLVERPDDIICLFEFFLETYNAQYGKHLTVSKDEIYPLLLRYPWPGNVREVESKVKRLVILGSIEELKHSLIGGSPLDADPSDFSSKARLADQEIDDGPILPLKLVAKEAALKAERRMILKALSQTNWNRKKAAGLLEISYKALLYKIKECGIE